MIRELLQKVLLKLSVFLNVQTSKTESYIYTTDTTINIFDVKSILFINKDETSKVFINSLPLDFNDSLTYNADSRSTITDNFNITFESSTSGRLFVTIIR